MPVDQQSGLLFSDAFTSRLTVAASDIDAFSHVNNAVYLKWMNDCAMEHSASVGLPAEACVDLDRGMAVRETRLVYQRPARLGDGVLVRVATRTAVAFPAIALPRANQAQFRHGAGTAGLDLR